MSQVCFRASQCQIGWLFFLHIGQEYILSNVATSAGVRSDVFVGKISEDVFGGVAVVSVVLAP